MDLFLWAHFSAAGQEMNLECPFDMLYEDDAHIEDRYLCYMQTDDMTEKHSLLSFTKFNL